MPEAFSLYPHAPEPVNPLAMVGQVAQTQNAMNQNRLFQREFQAQAGLGDAYRAATDPKTGRVDFNRLIAIGAQDPRIANHMGELVQQDYARRVSEMQIANFQQDIAAKQNAALNGALAPVLTKKGAQPGDVVSALASANMRGAVPDQLMFQMLGELTNFQGSGKPMQPEEMGEWLKQHAIQSLGPEQQADLLFPGSQTVDTGGQIAMGGFNRLTGQFQPGTVLNKTLSPSESAQRVPVFANGQPGSVSLGSLSGGGGGNALTRGPVAPSASGNPLTGAANVPAGFVPTAPALGAETEANEQVKASVDSYNTLGKITANANQRLLPLTEAYKAIRKTNTGPGTETRNQILSYVQSLPGIGGAAKFVAGGDPASIENYDLAVKYLAQRALMQAGDQAANTDSGRELAQIANASTHISNAAAQHVLRMNIALERYQQAQFRAFEDSGKTPRDFMRWSTDWNQRTDPRMFNQGALTKQQLNKIFGRLSDAEQKHVADMQELDQGLFDAP